MVIFRMLSILMLWGLGLTVVMMLVKTIVGSGAKLGSQKVHNKLKDAIAKLVAGLISFGKEEKQELAYNFQKTQVNKTFSYGYFSTIFKEPVLAYAKIDTNKGGCQIMGETTTMTCELRYDGQETSVYIDSHLYGHIDADSGLSDAKGKEIVKLDCNSYPLYDVIKENDQPAAYIDKKSDTSSNKRFFTMLNADIRLSTEVLVIYILYYKLIKTQPNNA